MSKKNENASFVGLVAFVSLLAVAIFAFGVATNSGVLSLGFVLIFTALLGWASYVGIRSGSIRQPSVRDETPAEKASCATTLSA